MLIKRVRPCLEVVPSDSPLQRLRLGLLGVEERVSVGHLEVLAQREDVRVLLFELVDGDSIGNGLNKASSWASSNNVEGFQPKIEPVRLKNNLEFSNQLRCKLLLSKIVGALYNS